MFEIRRCLFQRNKPCYCIRVTGRYLHSDGSIFDTAEYFPTIEDAQAVLDKFQPKHKWKHGDVFISSKGNVMMYLDFCAKGCKPQAVCMIAPISGPALNVEEALSRAKFLFNIKEKI